MDPITLHLGAKSLTASPSARTITGTIAAYNVHSTTQGVKLLPNCLTPRQPLNRVKLLRDHNKTDAVGFMAEYDAATLRCSFSVPEGEAGDEALTKAANGLRDGLSIGFQVTDYKFDEDYNLEVHAAELFEVSLCAIPDFQDAQIESVALSAARKKANVMTPEEIAAMQAELAAARSQLAAAAAVPAPVSLDANAFPQGGAIHTAPRARSLRDVCLSVSEAYKRGNPEEIRLALNDVIPADDAGKAFLGRPGWIGEVWQAAKSGRPWIESFGTPSQLTSMKLEGWMWDVRPKVQKYSGNKTEVPTNKPKTKPFESEAGRWAGGWDIDGIFFHLGSPDFLQSFWTAAAVEYDADSDTDVASQLVEAATFGGYSSNAIGAISGIASDLRKIGAKVGNIWLAEDVFEDYANLGQSEVPFWLANATGISLADAEATVADLRIAADDRLDAGQVVGYDKRAAEVREMTPIKLQAHDIAKGGVDLGFFSYGGVVIKDPRAIVKRTVGTAPAAG